MAVGRSAATSRGFSAIELMTGLAIGSVVMVGTLGVITQLGQFQSDTKVLNLMNQTYFSGVQTAQNSVLMNTLLNPTNDGALTACLASKGAGCPALPKSTVTQAVPNQGVLPNGKIFHEDTLNAAFDFDGPCVPGSGTCLVQRTTTYRWVCPTDTYCSGVEIKVSASLMPEAARRSGTQLAPRTGDFMLPARDFVAKRALATVCANTGSAISGIDFDKATNQDTCLVYSAGPTCTMPMKTLGTTDNCQPVQNKGCPQGFSTAGIYDTNNNCIGTVDVSKTVTLENACPGGGTKQPNGDCYYANRWCPLGSANPNDTLGFVDNDNGAIHRAGCYAGTWYNSGQIYAIGNGTYSVCMTGPANQYPLPSETYCPDRGKPNQPDTGVWTPVGNGWKNVPCPTQSPAGLPCSQVGGQCWTGTSVFGGIAYTCK